MKKILTIVALLMITTVRTDAQSKMQEILMKRSISKRDSVKLLHYLGGYGLIPDSNKYSGNRKLYIDSALSVAPWSALLWFEKALPLLFARKYEIGMPYLDSAVKYDKAGYIGYRGYIKCIFQKHCSESIADLTTAQQLDGEGDLEDHTYSFFVGLCYLQLNQFDSSEHLFTNSINKVKKEHGSQWVPYLDWFYLGITRFEKDDYTGAVNCLDSCLKIYPTFSDAEFYKSWCLYELHQYQSALELMTKANNDFNVGYTINDDNARYEPYPYQVNKYSVEESIKIFEKQNKKMYKK